MLLISLEPDVTCISEGRWQVWIKTNDLPAAGTYAQVSLTVYGDQGNSGPIILGDDEEEDDYFTPGKTDEFTVSFQYNVCLELNTGF